jgi:glycosyltransferase involved in cell wall biosynthesis
LPSPEACHNNVHQAANPSLPDAAGSVLLVGNFLSASVGVRGVCEDLAERLRGAGWRVSATSARKNRVVRLCDMLQTTWSRRRDYQIAHVEVYSGPAFRWAEAVCWMLRLLKKPFVLTLHGGKLPTFSERNVNRVRRLLTSASAVTAPSRYLVEAMRPYRSDLQLLPNALDLSNYPFHVRSAPHPRLIWLRAFSEIYNPSLAPRVIALLAEDFPDVSLTMVGPDKGDGSLGRMRHVAGELQVAQRIATPGAVRKADVARSLNQGDIFLNTTNADNTPVSVLEAMGCGLCVVSTNVGGIPHLLTHEENALLVPPDNPAAMAAAVRRILSDPALAARLSHQARESVAAMNWPVVLPQWESIFQRLVAA